MNEKVDTVFLASRFDEFSDLRSKLRESINIPRTPLLKAIDLNDGTASSGKPIDECILHVKKSNFFLLLLGDTYGSIPDGYHKSYTNIEYDEAFANNFKTTILVFCIGDSYADSKIKYSSDVMLSEWQKQVETRHTLLFFKKPKSNEESNNLAKDIYIELLKNIQSRYFQQLELEESLESIDEEDLLDEDEEADSLEKRFDSATKKEDDSMSSVTKI